MPTDQQISVLVDIASNRGANLRPDRLLDLMDLVAADYVEGDDDLYRLTTKGQNLLADRGVGVNESWPDQIGKAFPNSKCDTATTSRLFICWTDKI
jgi:hypothetical protein